MSFVDKIQDYIRRISTSEYLYFVIIVIGALLLGGITFSIVRKSPVSIGVTIIFPRSYFQTQMETIIVALGYISGFLGAYLIYNAKRKIHDPDYVNMIITMGIFLMLFSSFLLWTLNYIKR